MTFWFLHDHVSTSVVPRALTVSSSRRGSEHLVQEVRRGRREEESESM
jgi:hypothetical protein